MGNQTQSNQDLGRMYADSFKGLLFHARISDTFWQFDKERGIYYPLDQFILRQRVSAFVSANDPGNRQTIGKLDDIINHTKHHIPNQEDIFDPFVAFSDVSVDTRDFTIHPHSPENVATLYVPHTYSPKKPPSPLFDKFIKETCVTEDGKFDPDMEAQLQEIAGYLFHPDCNAEKAFFLYGSGANGKSVFVEILRALIGPERTSASSLHALTNDKFELSSIIGKRLVTSDEISDKELGGEKAKKLFSGQALSAQRKYGPTINVVCRAKFVTCCNDMPLFGSLDHAFRRRVMIITFFNRIDPRNADTYLAKKIISSELVGIIHWAFIGLKRLRENNWTFTESESTRKSMEEFEDANSSSVEFIREMYEISTDYRVTSENLYRAYVGWCGLTGRHDVKRKRFLKEISLILGPSQPTRTGGTQKRAYNCKPIIDDKTAVYVGPDQSLSSPVIIETAFKSEKQFL